MSFTASMLACACGCARKAPEPLHAPFDESTAKRKQEEVAHHFKIDVVQTNSVGMKLALIPAGDFEMGGSETLEV